VLVRSKRRGLVDSVRPIFDAFAANRYRFSAELVQDVLVRAGEA